MEVAVMESSNQNFFPVMKNIL